MLGSLEDTQVNKTLSQSCSLDTELRGKGLGTHGGQGERWHPTGKHHGRVQEGSVTVVKTMGSGARETKD